MRFASYMFWANRRFGDMARIIETTIIATLLLSGWAAWGGQVTDRSARFVKCKSHDCSYKIKVDGATYKIVSSSQFELDNEVQNIFDELEKEKAKASKAFCVTGKIISLHSKKISGDSFFKISSIGPVALKEKQSQPRRSHEAPMGECAF
jgi:hypothetical protein